jgi:dihydrolipoamide dehydrogenase
LEIRMDAYDLVVIGAGPGGYPAAIRGAQLGARVAIVEREAFGGTCLNWGCIPSKALIAVAELYGKIRTAGDFGIRVEGVSLDYAAMVKRKDQIVDRLHKGVQGLLSANGVKSIKGAASLQSRTRIAVAPPGGGPAEMLEAAKIILATGSTSSLPGFIPRHERVVESRAFLARTTLPASVIVLGGGTIGCEFAGMLAHLGSKVTIVEMLEDILAGLDGDIRREVRRHMDKSLGVRILTGKPLEGITADSRGVRGTAGGEALEAELLLVAVGRKPVTDWLNLAAAGLTATPRGTLEVDEFGRTAAANIYAIGDLTDGPQLAHRATSQGGVAAEHALGKGRRPNEAVVPGCIFTSPEIGTAGLGEDEAAKKGRPVKTGKFQFLASGRALASGEAVGFAKWVVDAETDQLVGAHVVGPHATELIAEAAALIRAEMTATALGHTVHAHPTLSEAWLEAAHAVHGQAIHAPPSRKPSSKS